MCNLYVILNYYIKFCVVSIIKEYYNSIFTLFMILSKIDRVFPPNFLSFPLHDIKEKGLQVKLSSRINQRQVSSRIEF